jgi:nucleotide-binding universal stress UspA family protein
VLLHVQPPPLIVAEPQIAYAAPQIDPAREVRVARDSLARLAAWADAPGATELRIEFGDPAEQLLAVARDEEAALIVTGARSHGSWRRALQRSVTAAVGPNAPCPVLVLPHSAGREGAPGGEARGGDGRHRAASVRTGGETAERSEGSVPESGPIVCGLDGSEAARTALRVAVRLSSRLALPLIVAHVVEAVAFAGPGARPVSTPSIGAEVQAGERVLEQAVAEEGLVDLERRVVYGRPSECLADIAEDAGAELLVVGSRGLGPVRAALLGSVSTDLILIARCPVVVVPQGAAATFRPGGS